MQQGGESMKVLVACEESQRVCIAFRERGHEAYSCDILEPSGGHPEWHILGDCLKILSGGVFDTMDGTEHSIEKWDLIIAFPPCTYTSNAGACHLFKGKRLNLQRFYKGLCGKALFETIRKADCEKIAVENPVPSKIYGYESPSQIIQPYEFGHPISKKTCLWLKGLEPLQPTNIVKPTQSCHDAHTWFSTGGKDRQRKRSITFQGIADAFAQQWGS